MEKIMTKYMPLRDFIVVSKIAEDEMTSGGLLFRPQTSESKLTKATVLAVGSGQVTTSGTTIPLEVRVGDTVMFSKNMAVELEGSDGALILREENILCIVK